MNRNRPAPGKERDRSATGPQHSLSVSREEGDASPGIGGGPGQAPGVAAESAGTVDVVGQGSATEGGSPDAGTSPESATQTEPLRAEPPPFSLERLRQVSEDVAQAFPMPLEGTELVLIDVDPRQVHAYWNVQESSLAEAAGLAGPGASLVLRFHDLTEGGDTPRPFDVEVQGSSGQSYVDLWGDAKRCVAELGLRAPDGRFFLLARSNKAETPRASVSPIHAFQTLDVAAAASSGPPEAPTEATPDAEAPPDAAQATAASEAASAGVKSMPPATGAAPSAAATERLPEAATQVGGGAALVDARAAEDLLEPVFPNVLGEAADADWEVVWGEEPPSRDTLRGAVSAAFPQRSAAVAGDQPTRVDVAAVTAGTEPGPLAPAERVALPPEIMAMGASPLVSPEAPFPAEPFVTLSSSSLGRRDTEFEMSAELRIFGRARPGTELTMFGRPVPLRPDGSFSITQSLPQGALVVPLMLRAGGPPPPSRDT
jgi:uncharacterized protein DUF4912